MSPLKSINLSSDKIRVWGYSQYDPIDLPRSIFEALAFFDGNPNSIVLERLRIEKDLELTNEWLRKLCDFGILRSASGSPADD